jgi:hypothetical protein
LLALLGGERWYCRALPPLSETPLLVAAVTELQGAEAELR